MHVDRRPMLNALRGKDNRKCYGCGNKLFEDGIRLLATNKDTEHCHRCSGYITRRGVLGHLIREKRDLQQQLTSMAGFNDQLQCALNRKREALDKARDDMEASKASPTADPAAESSSATEDNETPAEVAEKLVGPAPNFPRPALSHASAFTAPQPAVSSALRPGSGPDAADGPVATPASPGHRTKLWVQDTRALTPKDAPRLISDPTSGPIGVTGETSAPHPPEGGEGRPVRPLRTATLDAGPAIVVPAGLPIAQKAPIRRPSLGAFGAPVDDRDENLPPSPTYSGSARGTNYTGFTQISGLESRASMSDRGSERSFCSRPSSTMSHPMQTLRQSQNVRAAIAEDISFLDDLIKSYKKPPPKTKEEPPPSSSSTLQTDSVV